MSKKQKKPAEEGGEKKPHCDAMVYESVALVEEMMRQAGRFNDT